MQLMLMMLGCGPVLGKLRAADAHDAGVLAGALESGMLMMLGCGLVCLKTACI